MSVTPIAIKEDSLGKLVERATNYVHSHGETVTTIYGSQKSISSATLVLENFTNLHNRYLSWDQTSEEWYLNAFVRPTTPPEHAKPAIVFPYTYAWRLRFHDQGWGHVVLLVELLQKLNYGDLPFQTSEDIAQLIRETYQSIHPDVLLSVLAWLKRENLILFLINPQIAKEILKSTRNDLIQTITQQAISAPSTHKAITPSLLYSSIDGSGLIEHAPAFQNYQIVIIFDKNDKPIGFESFHHHRSLDASSSLQLDLAQDIDIGHHIAQKIGIPHTRLTIHTNQLFVNSDRSLDQTAIKEALLHATNAYEPDHYAINDLLHSDKYRDKIKLALQLFLNEE